MMMRPVSVVLAAAWLALPNFALADQKPANVGETLSADACVLQLGYEATETNTVVVTPGGAADVALSRIDSAAGGTGDKDLEVIAFDMRNCALVEVPVWAQDEQGNRLQEGKGPVTRFGAEHFRKGVTYLRAKQGVDMPIGFLIRRAV